MSPPFKVCPQCGVEYVPAALVCADCNLALEIASSEPAQDSAPDPLPPAAELTRIATGGAWEMERLALGLQRAGLSSRVDAALSPAPASGRGDAAAARDPSRDGSRLALYVLPADAQQALHVLRDLLGHDGIGAAAPPAASGELDACPACGAPASEIASACADCGLEFVPAEATCAACGAVLADDANACPVCGTPAPRDGA